MPYYLGPLIGDGSDANRFRPRASDGQVGWSMVDLRADCSILGGAGNNVCLLWLPVASADAQLRKVAESPDEIVSQADIDRINNALGTTLVPDTFANVVGDILMNPPTNKWKALKPTRGRHIVFLNGKIFDSPAAIGGGAEGYDNFKRPDSIDDLSVSWTPFIVAGNPTVGSLVNQRVRSGSSFRQAETSFNLFIPSSADQFAMVRIKTNNGGAGSDSTIAAMTRCTAGPNREFYAFSTTKDPSTPSDGWSFYKRVAGAFTQLDFNLNDPFLAGDWIACEVGGSNIVGRRIRNVTRDILSTVTDTSITTSLRGGMRVGNLTVMGDTEADCFICGDGALPKKYFIVPGGGAEPDQSMVVDTFDRVENPLTDISPITGLARWSLTSTQPVLPDDDTNPSIEMQADGVHCKHPQFGARKGCYRLDYQYGQEVQVGYEITAITPATSGLYGAVLRLSNPGTNNVTGYLVDCRIRDHGSTNDEWRIFRLDAGSPYTLTQIGSSVFGPNLAIGSLIAFQAVKSKIQSWHKSSGGVWTKINETTDATYSGPGYAAFYLNGTGSEGGNDPNTGLPVDQARIDNCFIGWRKFILSH